MLQKSAKIMKTGKNSAADTFSRKMKLGSFSLLENLHFKFHCRIFVGDF